MLSICIYVSIQYTNNACGIVWKLPFNQSTLQVLFYNKLISCKARQLINDSRQVHSPCAISATPTSMRTRAEYTFMMICVLFTWWKCTISYDTQCIVLHAFDFNLWITQRFSRWFPMRHFQRQAPIICVRIVSRKWFEKIKNCVYFITKWQQIGAQAFG